MGKPGDAVTAAVMQEAMGASAALPLVDYVAVAILHGMRFELLGMDQNDCFQRLLTGSPTIDPWNALELAKQLRSNGDKKAEEKPLPRLGEKGPLAAPTVDCGPLAAPTVDCGPLSAPLPKPTPVALPRAVPSPVEPPAHAVSAAAPTSPVAPPQQAAAPAVASSGYPGAGYASPGGYSSGGAAAAAQALPAAAAAATSSLFAAVQGLTAAAPSLATGASAVVEELRQRVAAAERERDTIRRKANEFVTAKKAELAARLSRNIIS